MLLPSITCRSRALMITMLASVLSLCLSPARASSPFDSLRGTWSGGGLVTLATGVQERLRCGATYQPSGPSVRMALRCASDSYKVEVVSEITSSGGQLSGTWSEASHQLQGDLTGSIAPGIIRASVKSATFMATVNVKTRGGNQSISIQAPGTAISNVAIALAR
jgi:hypothetical protein